MNLNNYPCWGRYPKSEPSAVQLVNWRDELPRLDAFSAPVLAYGCGKSYGDSCQNAGGVLLDMRQMNRFIEFNPEKGTFRVEAGVTLAQALDFLVPRGWFLASTPGTKFITVGGAVANDVHGKNHHKGGTFGKNVIRFELVRSTGEHFICSETENVDLFRATIGGLGLTGLITWVEFKLKPVKSAFIASQSVKFDSLEEFFMINDESERDFEYTVSWVDCTASNGAFGRGLYNRGVHADPAIHKVPKERNISPINFPIDAPFINKYTVEAFNRLYFHKQNEKTVDAIVHYNSFFYPLDAILNWNRAYGAMGFLQYQFVVPFGAERDMLREFLHLVGKSGLSSFLTVLKTFGSVKSPGMLSFPRPGVTMAIDFRITGEETFRLCNRLDEVVRAYNGVLYPGKDARMSGENFRAFYPQWEEFSKFIDPKFSSSFWRRVMQ
jgi:FAD/FMN-containing dehydrogenase